MTKIYLITLVFFALYTSNNSGQEMPTLLQATVNFEVVLDTVWIKEQTPILKQDSLIKLYGVESKEVEVQ